MANRYFTVELHKGRTDKAKSYTDWEGMADGDKVQQVLVKKLGQKLWDGMAEEARDLMLHYAYEMADSCDMATVRKFKWLDLWDFLNYMFGSKDVGLELPLGTGKAYAYRDEGD